MKYNEIRRWAKDKGYTVVKDKEDNQYYWAKLDNDDSNASGVARSVSKLATQIYNHLTDNKWAEYQKEYNNQLDVNISITGYK
jgi:hypothetical protein